MNVPPEIRIILYCTSLKSLVSHARYRSDWKSTWIIGLIPVVSIPLTVWFQVHYIRGDYDHIDKIFESTEQMILKDILTWNLKAGYDPGIWLSLMHHSNKYVYDCRMQNILINTCQDESYQRDQSHQMNTVSYWVYMRQLLSDQTHKLRSYMRIFGIWYS